jgi:biotin carboxyl carrier protein
VKFTYQVAGRVHTVVLHPSRQGYRLSVDGLAFEILVLQNDPGELRLLVGGRSLTFHWAADGPRRWVHFRGKTYLFERPAAPGARAAGADGSDRFLRAPMPGQIQEVQVAEGQAVERGQTLLLLEAMKMVIRVQAPGPGKVRRVCAQAGEAVEKDQILVELG